MPEKTLLCVLTFYLKLLLSVSFDGVLQVTECSQPPRTLVEAECRQVSLADIQ